MEEIYKNNDYITILNLLEKLNKKINKLEENDDDFSQNPKWKELRKQQDNAFLELAKIKEQEYKLLGQKEKSRDLENIINDYKRFIK